MLISYLNEIIQNPFASLLVVLNIVLLEAILSIDNAAVLATMVIELPKHQQKKALQYGIIGAYFFRTLAFFFASYLMQIWWLKFLGGVYLFMLFLNWFKQKVIQENNEEDRIEKKSNLIYRNMTQYLGVFVSTIIMVELMDLAFSIDNIFALSAYSSNLLLLFLGSFIGILFIRFATRGFIALIESNPNMEIGAYIIIFVLSVKLLSTILIHFNPTANFSKVIDSQYVDYSISIISLFIIIISLISRKKGSDIPNNI
jgi:YkoY family integral membrane protein